MYAGMDTHMYEEVYPKYLIVERGGVWEAHYPSAQVSNPCHLNEKLIISKALHFLT